MQMTPDNSRRDTARTNLAQLYAAWGNDALPLPSAARFMAGF
jgi:hypothetical protein